MPTVRDQLATAWDYISGAGVKVADNKIVVWRDGRWHFFCTFEGIDEIGYFRFGEGVWLYATQACVLTYGGVTWQLYAGWNNIGWIVDEPEPEPMDFMGPMMGIMGIAMMAGIVIPMIKEREV